MLALAVDPRTPLKLTAASGRTNRSRFLNQVLGPLFETGLIEMTIPDKPRGPNQQYRMIEVGWRQLRGGS